MIRVLYDEQAFTMQKYGGISRYFANLYQHFKRGEEVTARLGIKYSRNAYLKDLSPQFTPPFNNLWSNHKLFKLNRLYSKQLITQNQFDIFHPTYYQPYFLQKLQKPFVLTVHDMIHEIYPDYFPQADEFSRNKRILAEKAAHIIAISDSTKSDLIRLLGIEEEKISVVYHGYNALTGVARHSFSPLAENYILYVGDRRVYKNFARFIEGAAKVLHKNKQLHIICAGGGDFGLAEQELFIRNGVQNKIAQCQVTDAELHVLYNKARAFVFPSLYEGFGFPILEAFASGCPVAVSDTSCFREIAGNAALYFNPFVPEEIGHCIEQLIENNNLANDLMIKGKQLVNRFTIDQSILHTAEIYKKVYRLNNR